MEDKFFYDIWQLDSDKFAFQLYIQTSDDEYEEFDDVLEFDTAEEAEEHKGNLPDFAYHIEQFGDV